MVVTGGLRSARRPAEPSVCARSSLANAVAIWVGAPQHYASFTNRGGMKQSVCVGSLIVVRALFRAVRSWSALDLSNFEDYVSEKPAIVNFQSQALQTSNHEEV